MTKTYNIIILISTISIVHKYFILGICNSLFFVGFRIIVGLVSLLTVVGSGYEMILERRKAKELKKRHIAQGNNNESDSKVEFTLDKMHAIENMHNMKGCRNDDGTLADQDLLFKGNKSLKYYVFNELKINIQNKNS